MIYKVYQIQLNENTKDLITQMNLDFSGNNISRMSKDAYEEKLYKEVAHIEAEDLDEVFTIGNIGPEEKITRLERMHSLSVGDLICDENHNYSVVAPVGWKNVEIEEPTQIDEPTQTAGNPFG